jgi:hypothetical protein
MDFLRIIQVLPLFLYSKSIAKSIFPVLFNFWTVPQILEKTGASAQLFLRRRGLCIGRRVIIYNSIGALMQLRNRRGTVVSPSSD